MAKSQRTENMNLIEIKYVRLILCLFFIQFLNSCSDKYDSPESCVNSFIESAEQHDMTKAWSILGPDAKNYYNDIGAKNRKSGKGILEHDISEIKNFYKINRDYKIVSLPQVSNIIILVTVNNDSLLVETFSDDGSYKIKNSESVKNIISCIAGELENKDYY